MVVCIEHQPGHAPLRSTQSQVHAEGTRLHDLFELRNRDDAAAVLLRIVNMSYAKVHSSQQ